MTRRHTPRVASAAPQPAMATSATGINSGTVSVPEAEVRYGPTGVSG